MADLSKIVLPSGTTYDLKDAWAREQLSSISGGVMDFLGVTTTTLTDGATTNPIKIDNKDVTATKGDVVLLDGSNKEFVFNGSAWAEFGDMTALGTLAYKNSASGNFTPAGGVSQPTFSGTPVRLVTGNISVPNRASFTGTAATVSVSGTPAGTVSKPSFSGTAATISAKGTPSGTVSKPSWTGTAATISAKGTPAGSIANTFTGTAATVSASYTPGGTVGTPTISVKTAGSTASISKPSGMQSYARALAVADPGATAPTNAVTYYSVSSETLILKQLGYTTANAVSATASQTVKTGDAAYQSSQPSWTGTAATIKGGITPAGSVTSTFTGTALTSTAAYTPSGSVGQPSFSGAELTSTYAYTPAGGVSQPSFSGAELTSTGAYTPAGSVGFSNTNKTATVTTASGDATYTPAGTVSKPTFSGTQGSVSVS